MILILSVLEILISVTVQSVYCTEDKDRPLTGAARVIALICTAVTCKKNHNRRYDTESIPETRTESTKTPDSLSKITLKRKPSIVIPDSSIKKPNGELRRARTEYAWNKKNICDGRDKMFTAKDLDASVNSLCFILFFLFWLTSTIVIMVILSSPTS